MATFTNKPAPGTYTVNTGHAKCPDHLYMFDEGTFTVSSATNASPVEFTLAANHGWPNGATLTIDFAGFTDSNWTAFNTGQYEATATAPNKFTVPTNTTSYGAYTSGGTGFSCDVADRGKTGGQQLAVQSAVNQWTTQDLGGGGPSSSIVALGDDTNAWYGGTSFSIGTNKNCMLVCLVRHQHTTARASQQFMMCLGTSTSTNIAAIRTDVSSALLQARWWDTTTGTLSVISDTNLPDDPAVWHLVVARFRQDGTTIRVLISVDGEAIANHASTDTGTAAWDFNRIAVMDNSSNTGGTEYNGYVAMAAVYKNSSDPANEWNDTFVSSLYSDPWQFLNTGSGLILPHRSSGGMIDLSGNFRG